MATKTKSSSVRSSLMAELEALRVRIAELDGESLTITVAAALRLTEAHWHALRFAMVVGGAEKPQLAQGRKGYALVKGTNPAWYMGCKGFELTLKSLADRKAKGEDVEVRLYETPNPKTGVSQAQRAAEVLSQMADAGIIDAKSPIFAGETKARKAKSSK